MDHDEALQKRASRRYLAGELSEPESSAFEEHFFDCSECAEEVTGSLFESDTRAVFKQQARATESGRAMPVRPVSVGWWQQLCYSFAIPVAVAAGALLAIVIYQSAVAIPRLKSEVAALSAPQDLPSVPLKLARGNESVVIPKDKNFWMAYFYLPKSAASSAYSINIETRDGTVLKTLKLAAPALGQPSSILLRRSDFPGGTYLFKVRDHNSSNLIATYTLDLNPE